MRAAASGRKLSSRSRSSEKTDRTGTLRPEAMGTSLRTSSAGRTPSGSSRVSSELPALPGAQIGSPCASSQSAKTSSRPFSTRSDSRR